jgi:hypothetical protein
MSPPSFAVRIRACSPMLLACAPQGAASQHVAGLPLPRVRDRRTHALDNCKSGLIASCKYGQAGAGHATLSLIGGASITQRALVSPSNSFFTLYAPKPKRTRLSLTEHMECKRRLNADRRSYDADDAIGYNAMAEGDVRALWTGYGRIC